MNNIMQDLRYALRALVNSPGFTATAILTLALGIGASTAVFTAVDAVVLKPLAYRDSGKLVVAWERVRFLSGEPTGPNPRHVDVWQHRSTFFLVRATHSPDALIPAMRQAIWKYAPDVTVARVKTLDSQIADSLSPERFQTSVLLAFGAAALLLAMLGIYGVLNYSVVTRKQEIGMRMALGATRANVYALTMTEAGTPVIAGIAAGLAASLLAGHTLQRLLYGTRAVDFSVMAAVAALFILSAVAAAFLPARRAASIDPIDALRSE